MNYPNKFLCCDSYALTISVANPAASNAAETTMATLKLYKTHCAECHNEKRLGAMGPALLPANIKRLRKKAAVDVITNDRAATQMPAFAEKLSEKGIKALVDNIYNLKLVAEIRAGINTHNLVVSADGRYVMAANYLPHSFGTS